ncbi:hypothetical protein PENTCL1PPCAC_19756, partial [Pristionchus entomophagus]
MPSVQMSSRSHGFVPSSGSRFCRRSHILALPARTRTFLEKQLRHCSPTTQYRREIANLHSFARRRILLKRERATCLRPYCREKSNPFSEQCLLVAPTDDPCPRLQWYAEERTL